jgi:hypothetical protein
LTIPTVAGIQASGQVSTAKVTLQLCRNFSKKLYVHINYRKIFISNSPISAEIAEKNQINN